MLQSTVLSALSGVRHAFFTRAGGVSEGCYASLNGGIGSNDAPERIAENRARMAAAVGVTPDRFLTAYQIHSPNVVVVEAPWDAGARPKADALVTKVPALAIGISTADCGPILFADAQAGVVGAAHAGWRGAIGGVAEATIAAMECCGADRARIVAALGPMIQQANYEVGPEFVAQFAKAEPDNERFFVPAARAGHALFDLAGYIGVRLSEAGIRHIHDVGGCTYGRPDLFYSYRRSVHRAETDYGRHISAIALCD
jgi:purine-nucleoside/S-methyl-5'-thioadenosine phosphorylase / adenosine deaminase